MSSEEKLEELKIRIRDLPVEKRVELAEFIHETLKGEPDDDNPI
jgi:hypothetical protein